MRVRNARTLTRPCIDREVAVQLCVLPTGRDRCLLMGEGVDILDIARRLVVVNHRCLSALPIRVWTDQRRIEAQFLPTLQLTFPVLPPLMRRNPLVHICRLANVDQLPDRNSFLLWVICAGIHAVDSLFRREPADIRRPPVSIEIQRVTLSSHPRPPCLLLSLHTPSTTSQQQLQAVSGE